jgi:hypothetical protein
MSQPPTLSSLSHAPANADAFSPATSVSSHASASTSAQSGGPARPAYFSSRLRVRSLCDTFLACLYF